jgi:CBS domain-containing protein
VNAGGGLLLGCQAAPVRVEDRSTAETLRDLRTSVEEVMERDVTCVAPDLSLAALKVVFLTHAVRGFPVSDAGGLALGFVSHEDVLAHLIDPETDARQPPPRVRDIMMPFTFVLRPGATVRQAAQLMAYEGVNHLPVVDAGNRILGMLTTGTLARWIAG